MLQISHAITELDGMFVDVDDAYCQILHLTPTQLYERNILSITHHADCLGNSALLHKLVDCGTPFWIRKRYRRDDHSLVWVLNHVSLVVGITGKKRIAAACFLLPPNLRGDDAAVLSVMRERFN